MGLFDFFRSRKKKKELAARSTPERLVVDLNGVDPSAINPPETRFTQEYKDFLASQGAIDRTGDRPEDGAPARSTEEPAPAAEEEATPACECEAEEPAPAAEEEAAPACECEAEEPAPAVEEEAAPACECEAEEPAPADEPAADESDGFPF